MNQQRKPPQRSMLKTLNNQKTNWAWTSRQPEKLDIG